MRNFILFLLFFHMVMPVDAQDKSVKKVSNPGISPYQSYAAFRKDKAALLASPHVKNVHIMFTWRDMEPKPGKFAFEETISYCIAEGRKAGIAIAFQIWVGPSAPDWIYEHGVPLVEIAQAGNSKYNGNKFPYYFSPVYKNYFFRFIDRFGAYIKSLPENEVKQLLYFQPSEGTTGDTNAYHSTDEYVVDKKYLIPRPDWMKFRMEVWERYRKGLWKDGRTVIPMLFTDDSNTDVERDWQLKNLPVFGVKKGNFSHGYNNNNSLSLLDPWRELQAKAAKNDNLLFARGEFDNILLRQGWVKKNPSLAFYWSAMAALFYDIDYWNAQVDIVMKPEQFIAGLEFYNSHVGSLHRPAEAEYAFCAMHRMLNAADTEAFPESRYGVCRDNNLARYENIIAEFAANGAKIGDISKVGAGSMASRARKDYNDIGWMVYPDNFYKHLTQVDPEGTSDAYWNLDATIYGRFARGFKSGGKGKIYFELDKQFFSSAEPQKVRISVIYKDQDNGSWELYYHNGKLATSAGKVTNIGSNKWVNKEFILNNAVFDGRLEKNADLILQHAGGDNIMFHMVDLKRL